MSQLESQIQFDCLVWLNQNGWFAFTIKTQGTYDEKTQNYRKGSVFAISGVADVYAIKDGVGIWIEMKTERGVQSKAQLAFQKQIELKGGRYLLIRSLKELKEVLGA